MIERPIQRDDRDVEAAMEYRELAAFFRELGLGWECDAEGLVERLTERGSRR